MAIQSLSRASVANANRKYNNALAGNPLYSDMELISTVLLTSTAGVAFYSIPQTYKHLQIRVVMRSSVSTPTDFLYSRINGDSAVNYSTHHLQGDGTSVTSGSYTAYGYTPYGNITGNTAPTNAFGAAIIDILDYANTSKYKTLRSLSGLVGSSSGLIKLGSGSWRSTAAITDITVNPSSADGVAGTRVSLYGIKG